MAWLRRISYQVFEATLLRVAYTLGVTELQVSAGSSFAMTECLEQPLWFESHGRREVVAESDGGAITSDAGGLLLQEIEQRLGIVRQFVGAFTDHRDEQRIDFTVEELLLQRVMGIALGYEDLNDHDRLRHDPLLALVCGRADITGQDRALEADRGKPLAGKSTLNRLELTLAGASEQSRNKKIVASVDILQHTLVVCHR